MAVSKRLRHEVMKRDNYTCRYCRSTENALTIDHVIPVTLGGSDEPGNLVAACKDCNAGKSSTPADAPLIAEVAADALRMARALEIVAEQRAAERKEADAIYRKFKREWRSWYITDWRGDKHYVDLPGDWQRSVDQFLDAGLTLDDLIKMIGVALGGKGRGGWKYFCGCCWNLVRDIQDRATAIVNQQSTPPPLRLSTRWTEGELSRHMSMDDMEFKYVDGLLECEIHNDAAVCARDSLCQVVAAARTREMLEAHAVWRYKRDSKAERINGAAEEAEDDDAA